jgi:hypothetical protein
MIWSLASRMATRTLVQWPRLGELCDALAGPAGAPTIGVVMGPSSQVRGVDIVRSIPVLRRTRTRLVTGFSNNLSRA